MYSNLPAESMGPARSAACLSSLPCALLLVLNLIVPLTAPARAIVPIPDKVAPSDAWRFAAEWKPGDQIQLGLKLERRLVVGDHKNEPRGSAVRSVGTRGDEALLDCSLENLSIAGTSLSALYVTPEPAPPKLRWWPGAQVFRVNAVERN